LQPEYSQPCDSSSAGMWRSNEEDRKRDDYGINKNAEFSEGLVR